MKISTALQLFLSILAFIFVQEQIHATHNIAGRIEYEHAPLPNEELRYCFTVITYSKNESTSADRDTLNIDFGDGIKLSVPRTNGNGEPLLHNSLIKLNTYEICHTYQTTGEYIVSMLDPNRTGGIINISNSIDVAFYIETKLLVKASSSGEKANNSPIILAPPIDLGNFGEPYIYNSGVYDPDGDDLKFELIVPLSDKDREVPGYKFPNEFNLNPPVEPNEISIDSNTGELVWNSPRVAGIYTIAILISEYRGGFFIGSMIWDMQITMGDFGGEPPSIVAPKDTTILIGGELNIGIKGIDVGWQNVILEAFGAPFIFENSPAIFEVINQGESSVEGIFSWKTDCSHLSRKPYTIVLRASDQENPPSTAVTTLQISLVPPAPADVEISVLDNGIELTWETAACTNPENLRGYRIWRKEACDDTDFTSANTNLLDEGYTSLTFLPTLGNTYTDLSAVSGVNYTYRVVAEYADILDETTPFGFGLSFSLPSQNSCVYTDIEEPKLQNDLPLFEIFPNPIENIAQVHFSNIHLLQSESMIFEAYNLQGRQMEIASIEVNKESVELNTENWQSGVYVLQLKSEGRILQSEKVVVF